MGSCATDHILGTTVTLERLVKRGYTAMLTLYEKANPKYSNDSHTLFPMF